MKYESYDSQLVSAGDFADWLRRTNTDDLYLTVATSYASEVFKAVTVNVGWHVVRWDNLPGTKPMQTKFHLRKDADLDPTGKAIRQMEDTIRKMEDVRNSLRQPAKKDLPATVDQTWKPPKPEEDFFKLRRKFITGDGSIEAKERMLAKVTLRIDDNGDYHWSPDPEKTLWDPPSRHIDGLALSKRDYLRREGLLPARQKGVRADRVWAAAALMMVITSVLYFVAAHDIANGVITMVDAFLFLFVMQIRKWGRKRA